ncbi:MAG: hypothetical protein PHH11_05105 [Methylomonas sp.]|nr:hypothetical protein [Methylomonas sp.]
MKILNLLVATLAEYWAKYGPTHSNESQAIELFPSRGVTFVKRTLKGCGNQSSDASVAGDEILATPDDRPLSTDSRWTEESASSEQDDTGKPSESKAYVGLPRSAIPEDSVLRRHYLAMLAAEQAAISNPYPTDSVLRRHYEQQRATLLPQLPKASSFEIQRTPEASMTEDSLAGTEKSIVPEDSVLRRHFLSQLRSKIESQVSPVPSDAVLKRHYAQLIQSKMDVHLAGN